MYIKEIADTLVAHCKAGTEEEALNTLYAADVVSAEAQADPDGGDGIFEGLEALRGKHTWWNNNNDVHALKINGPFIFRDDRFAVKFSMDVTDKNTGQRNSFEEIAVYYVKNGKIVREEFFY